MTDIDSGARLVLTTAGSDEQADSIARALVERRLAACVSLVHNVCSVYRWQGGVERESEVLLVVKTRTERAAAVAEAIRELHTYDVPELLEIPVAGGGKDYLDWLLGQVD